MPYNGSGTFNQLYNWNTEATSPPIEITKLQSECDDMASALSNCITRDGQGKPTATQDWNGQSLINVNNLTATGSVTVGSISVPSINNTPIGNTTPNTGAFTTLSATTGNITTVNATSINSTGTISGNLITAAQIYGTAIGTSGASTGAFTTLSSTGATILGATTASSINSTPVGNTTRSTGAFTTLSSNNTTTLGATSATSIDSTPIGATTRSTGAFTTLFSNNTTVLGATSAVSLNNTPIGASTPSTGTFTTLTSSSTTTLGSTTATSINSTPIGATTRSTGAFTTLASNSTTTLGATTATSINNTPIGATSASTGSFTTLAASGDVTFNNDPSLPTQTGFKNLIINGAMDIFQRSVTGTINVTSGTTRYTLDRWFVSSTGSTVAVSQPFATSNIFWRVLQVDGSASNTSTIIGQRIESFASVGLPNRRIAVSFVISRVSGASINVSLYRTGTRDVWTTPILVQTQSINPTSSLSKFVLYFNAMPTNIFNGLALQFELGAHTATDIVQITGVQVEPFETTTANTQFEYRPLSYETMLCQRYALACGDQHNNGGCAASTSTVQTRYNFDLPMRATPTVTLQNNGTFYISDDFTGDFNSTTTTLSSSNASISGARVLLGGFTGLTLGRFYGGKITAGTARILFDSEL